MHKTKRPLSLLLAVLMIVGIFASVPFTASAANSIAENQYIRLGKYNGVDVDWYCAKINSTGTFMYCKYALKSGRFGANATYTTSDIHAWLDLDSGGTFATDLGLQTYELSLVRTVNLSSTGGDGTDSFIIPAYVAGANEMSSGSAYKKAPLINEQTYIPHSVWLRTARDTSSVRVIRQDVDETVSARYRAATNNNKDHVIRPMFYLDLDAFGSLTFTGTGTEDDPYVPVDPAPANEVIGLINAIGTVEPTAESKEKIDAARAAYEALTDAQKALVTNYKTLTVAEESYTASSHIAINSTQHGTVTASAASAQAGTTVTLTAAPDDGYQLKDISGTYVEPSLLGETLTGKAYTVNGTYFTLTTDYYSAYGWKVRDTSSVTLSSTEKTIEKAVFTVGSTRYDRKLAHLSATSGTISAEGNIINEGTTLTIDNINANSVTLSGPEADTNARAWDFSSVTVYYKGFSADSVEQALSIAPTENPNVFTFTMPESSVAISAEFEWITTSHTITWLNDDGSLIDTTTVDYGTVPTHADATKAEDAQYTYTFSGWTPAIVAVTGDATYTATFTTSPSPAALVIEKINAIGTVEYTDASKEKIDAARAAYDSLTNEQKALVMNATALTAAETAYAELKAAAAALAQAKTDAKAELDSYKNAADYRDAQKTELADAITAGKDAIENAADTDAVATALANAKTAIDAIKTDAELTAEEAANTVRIGSVDDWNSFAESVKNGNTYSGKTVL
ncbi:MAG: hypothetical protein IJT41_07825, partial [Clostridia bacterium]|nr:hypothetical protein [Clostridia bacterium]